MNTSLSPNLYFGTKLATWSTTLLTPSSSAQESQLCPHLSLQQPLPAGGPPVQFDARSGVVLHPHHAGIPGGVLLLQTVFGSTKE